MATRQSWRSKRKDNKSLALALVFRAEFTVGAAVVVQGVGQLVHQLPHELGRLHPVVVVLELRDLVHVRLDGDEPLAHFGGRVGRARAGGRRLPDVGDEDVNVVVHGQVQVDPPAVVAVLGQDVDRLVEGHEGLGDLLQGAVVVAAAGHDGALDRRGERAGGRGAPPG